MNDNTSDPWVFTRVRLLLDDDRKQVAIKFDLDTEEWFCHYPKGFYLYRVDGANNDIEPSYKEYLKQLLRCCVQHLEHLPIMDLIESQVTEAVWKSKSANGGYRDPYLSIEAFARIFGKQFKEYNLSYCFYLILYMVLEHNARSENPCNFASYLGKDRECLTPITPDEFQAAKYKVFAITEGWKDLPRQSVWVEAWHINQNKETDINFYASKLLMLLAVVGDAKSIETLLECAHFAVQDVTTLAQCIDVAIAKDNHRLLVKLAGMLQQIEPFHPTVTAAEAHLRRVALLTKSSMSVEAINTMSGADFEIAIRNALQKHSLFELVQTTPSTGDFGADLIITTTQGTRVAVQCKRFGSKVNLKAVQEVVAAVKHYTCDLGVVVSNNGYLPSARQLAESNGIELWDGEAVLKIFAGQFDFSEVFSL